MNPRVFSTPIGYQNHDHVNVLFETTAPFGTTTLTNQMSRYVTQRVLEKLPVSPTDNPTNASRSNSETHSGPNIPTFPNQFVNRNTTLQKTKKPKTISQKGRYRSDSEEDDSTGVKKPKKKSRKSGKSAVTVRSDAGGGVAGGSTASKPVGGPSGHHTSRLSDLGPYGLKWYRGFDHALRILHSSVLLIHHSLVTIVRSISK
jgi:hypothetical protein